MTVKLGTATDDVGSLFIATGLAFPPTTCPLTSLVTLVLSGVAVLTAGWFGLRSGCPGGLGRDCGLLCLACLVPGLAILSG